jgi:hypothetical protein
LPDFDQDVAETEEASRVSHVDDDLGGPRGDATEILPDRPEPPIEPPAAAPPAPPPATPPRASAVRRRSGGLEVVIGLVLASLVGLALLGVLAAVVALGVASR